MVDQALPVLFWTWPILLGLILWLTKASFAVKAMDALGTWLAKTREGLKASPSRIARYWARPTIVVAHSPFTATAAIPNSFLRAGARVAIAPYVAGLIFVGTLIALELAIAAGCLLLVLMIWGFISNLLSGDEKGTVTDALPVSRVRGTRLVNTGFLGDSPTGTRIDETGRVMEEGLLGDAPTGVQVTDDGRITKEGFLSDSPTGFKINTEGQLVKEGFLGDTPTGVKIDPDGRVVNESLLGDSPTGQKFEKE
jgi:hypothetical protein